MQGVVPRLLLLVACAGVLLAPLPATAEPLAMAAADAGQSPVSASSQAETAPAPAGEGDPPATLSAEQLDYDGATRVFRAHGGVVMEQEGLRLTADEVLWQDSTRDVVASGQVRLTEPGGELQGSSVTANLTPASAWSTKARFLCARTISIWPEQSSSGLARRVTG